MTRLSLPLSALASLLALAACNKPAPEVVDTTAPDPNRAALANAAPVELPPAVRADVTLRCKDNSLVYVTFFQGDKQVNVRTEKGGQPTQLKAPEAGQPYTAEGYSLTGDEKNVTLKQPGKGSLVCHA
ncbi:hypothetical protein [Sphingomonas aracearum]|uniref:C-type lysozyme inhibitor domain-containing protein n=1 Tax=Sphingomonas aracearum TaxID=2283317 RepID=A0A369W0T9_9SPHN|nr:hypothetical protein [Sphingomonas aracearum]RDE06970.1 hypothetical protein DVW87_04705 [Sphingomonas aracearum]